MEEIRDAEGKMVDYRTEASKSMDRTRIKLAVYVDLDEVPGAMHSADSARNLISNHLTNLYGHYRPMVSIESYDTRVPAVESHDSVHDDPEEEVLRAIDTLSSAYKETLALARETYRNNTEPAQHVFDRSVHEARMSYEAQLAELSAKLRNNDV